MTLWTKTSLVQHGARHISCPSEGDDALTDGPTGNPAATIQQTAAVASSAPNGYMPTTHDFMALLKADQLNYAAVFGTIPTTVAVGSYNVALDFHYLRFNGNGQPKTRELVDVLANHLVLYAIDATRIKATLTDQQRAELHWEAIAILRKYEASGEAGELLLYFLMESVLKAPQVVAKVSLKTNPNVEVHGSDGIHARWNDETETVELFFGEAKVYDSIYGSLDDACKSITKFYAEGQQTEIRLLTNHYKHAQGPLKDFILDYAKGTEVKGSASLNHAVLLGYDWAKYQQFEGLQGIEREATLRAEYAADDKRLWDLLETRLKTLNVNHVRLHVFFLPFQSVAEFRKAFREKVFGGAGSGA